jgi:hypothetical protein
MSKILRSLAAMMLVLLAVAGCKHEKTASNEPESFAFITYPGSRYLPENTKLTMQAHAIVAPGTEAPPTAIYDTDAPLDKVAEFYAKSYGYSGVAPDASNNLSSAKPPAYYRSGDIGVDLKGIEPILQKMNLHPDESKAAGKYKAAEIAGKPNRPHVTLQRPYFDIVTSQVVDRTIILMAK